MGELHRTGRQVTGIFSFSLCLTSNCHQTSIYKAASREEGPKAYEEKHQLLWTVHCDNARMSEPRTRAASRIGMGQNELIHDTPGNWTEPSFQHPFNCFVLFLEGPEHYTTSLRFPTKIFAYEFPPVPMR